MLAVHCPTQDPFHVFVQWAQDLLHLQSRECLHIQVAQDPLYLFALSSLRACCSLCHTGPTSYFCAWMCAQQLCWAIPHGSFTLKKVAKSKLNMIKKWQKNPVYCLNMSHWASWWHNFSSCRKLWVNLCWGFPDLLSTHMAPMTILTPIVMSTYLNNGDNNNNNNKSNNDNNTNDNHNNHNSDNDDKKQQ